MEKPIHRANVLVVRDNKFVLIFRHKNSEDYYAIPGGAIEVGESPQDAAVREIQEELGFSLDDIKLVSEIKNNSRYDFNFIAHTSDSDFIVTGPEKNHLNNPDDLFRPEWHNVNSYRQDIPLYPEASRKYFVEFIKNIAK